MATKKKTIKAPSAGKPAVKAAAQKKTQKTAGKKIEAKQKPAVPAKKVVRETPRKAVAKPAAAGARVSPKQSGQAAAPEVKPAPKTKKKMSEREERLFKIKLHLVRQRHALLHGAESALNELPGQTIFPDLGDQATAETDRNFMLRLRGREQRLLKKIDEAIERIDTGTFGICDDCGNEIDIKRLEVRPVTTMCIECKTLQEEEEKLRET